MTDSELKTYFDKARRFLGDDVLDTQMQTIVVALMFQIEEIMNKPDYSS